MLSWITAETHGLRSGECFDFGSGPPERMRNAALTVMTWNIAYARGPRPNNRVNRPAPKPVQLDRLQAMGRLIRKRGVDLLLLQEVDFASKRSHDIDQLQALAKGSGLRFGARAVSWRSRYVPYPYWPPDQHYGRVMSGGAVLSRYPLTHAGTHLHPKPARNGRLYNRFYLFRYSQHVQIAFGDQCRSVINNHLEAFDKGNRLAQAHRLLRLTERLEADESTAPLLIVGGDMNTVPPEARVKHGFADDPKDDYRNDATLRVLRRMPTLRDIVPLQRYIAQESEHFTFPTLQPTRRLDYLFVSKDATVGRYQIVHTDDYSDHLPLLAELKLS